MKIAVVGTGIAGLGAAYVLSRAHDVELFERNDYAGGHTNTVTVDARGRPLALDTGFLVHNVPNYPQLVRLFGELGVATQPSQMSFSVSCRRCGLEYSGRRPFADPANLVRPRFGSLLFEIARWLRTARGALEDRHEGLTLAEFLDEQGYSRRFRAHFLVPLTSALWSTAPTRALDFPAAHAVRFFENHGMLGARRHGWRTVTGGSQSYVRAIRERIGDRVRLGAEVTSVRRDDGGIEVTTREGRPERFDRVVVATHPDQALRLLADPSDDERRLLGAFRYTANETVLHTDARFVPRRRSARASWNYQVADCMRPVAAPTMTYYLNRLQALDEPRDYCVTLNRRDEIAPESVLETIVYEHPLFTLDSLRAQRELPVLNGPRNTVYAGAWHGYGFHEDGLRSGVRAAADLGVRW